MTEMRLPAYPLITVDPLFSVWSFSDKLYESSTVMWTGAEKPMGGNIEIDGVVKRFMGQDGAAEVIEQRSVSVSLTATKYVFSDDKVELTVTFTAPFLINEPALSARPVNYIDVAVKSVDGAPHDVQVVFDFSEKLVYEKSKKLTRAGILPYSDGRIGYLGRLFQKTIATAGDKKEIDWGWLYLAGDADIAVMTEAAKKKLFKGGEKITLKQGYRKLLAAFKHEQISADKPLQFFLSLAYDDIYSLNYFGEYKKGYWVTSYYNIINAVQESIASHDEIIAACRAFDEENASRAEASFGKNYRALLEASYRQVVAGHKMVADGENILVFSKENSSNGCMGTADVNYPACPLFLLYNPALVKGMLLPIFNYARMRSWPFDFAPHDVGVYPYATGQVYGANPIYVVKNLYIPFRKHIYRNYKNRIYNISSQMPVEECGNMLIMSAAYFNESGDFNFIRQNADMLSQWADYLVKQGVNMPFQLCTDDFLGAGEKNINLAVKSITGIAAWALMLNQIQPGEGNRYMDTAKSYAKELERISDLGGHMAKTIGDRRGWSLKYNLIWDVIFKTELFSHNLIEKEAAFYLDKLNKYGIPLDDSGNTGKTDWMVWSAALDRSGILLGLLSKNLVKMLAETESRVPFTDYYDTLTGDQSGFFARTVLGGLWMAEYKKHAEENKGYLY